MADRLRKAEQTLLHEFLTDSSNIRKIRLTHPDLGVVGRIQDGELEMPWDSAAEQVMSSQDDRSAALVLQAQHAEFTKNNLRQAAGLLNQALALATSAFQKSSVGLQIGRILTKSGDMEGALRLYKEILDQPGELTDEYGIPFSLYAADRLSGLSGDHGPLLDRLEGLLKDNGRHPPAALHFIRDILAQLEAKAAGSLPAERIRRLRQAGVDGLAPLERSMGVKRFV